MRLEGRVIKGKGIASGKNIDPETGLTNTIGMQKPFFKMADIPYIEDVYNGTVNMDISPNEFKINYPDYFVENVAWHVDATESFQFVKTDIVFGAKDYSGYIYYPMPSKLKSHPDTRIELLAPKIPDLEYGKKIAIFVADGKISVKNPLQQPQ
jgi:hypothetical protein